MLFRSVLTALFLVLLVEQYKQTTNHKPLVLGLSLSVVALLIFGPDSFMIPALIMIVISLIALKSRIEEAHA